MVDCVVVGGGLSGMLVAWELAQAGLEITVLERGEPGRESSWAGGGILSPLYPWRYPEPVTRLATWSQARYPAVSERLKAETGIDPEWTRSGLLILDMDEGVTARRWADEHGCQLRVVAGKEVKTLEPSLGSPADSAIWMPDVAQVRNPRLMKALGQMLDLAGVTVRAHAEVTGLSVSNGRVHGVTTAEGTTLAENVVIAGGAWSAGLLSDYGCTPQVGPVRGQMILFKATPGLLTRIVLSHRRYLIPRRDGRILVGSTVEHVGFDRSTSREARDALRAVAVQLVPALEGAEVEHHWAGLRPASPNGVPYVGAHPEVPGLYVNAGHFRNGVVLGLASARLTADLLLGRAPVVDPNPYALTAPRQTTEEA